uniref:Uncharacterized mitochondrial protein AtMg00810-like n=1 Tax=Tanacetum cinerariifolium TaxID=118510 RepID=A0A699HA91_TANCI|nr:uncharacterized mitochondrial protein AtMg00810-like [Tanacetum cinerariifolium]
MKRMVKEQGGLTQIYNDNFYTCVFTCFLSQEEPKRVHQALKDPSWFEAMQEELLQFKIKKGFEDPDYTDKVYKVVKVLYGLHQDPTAWYETLANYLLENGFQRGKIDGKSASTPIDTENPLLKDPDGEDVDVHTYRSMIGSLMYLTLSRLDIMFVVYTYARFQVTPKASHLHAVKRIFRNLKGKPHVGLWYPKDSPFNLVAYSDSDYAGASLDKNSTTRGFQFLGCKLISWQCKKQTVVATSSTKAEHVVNYVVRLQALIDRQKVIITEDTVRQALHLDDAESIDCLPNEEIFAELARMGGQPGMSLVLSWLWLLSASQQLMISAQVGDLSSYTTKYTSLALTQKVFTNMRRVGKGFSGVDTPLFKGMFVPQQAADDVTNVVVDDDVDDVVAEDVAEPTLPSPLTIITPPPLQELPSTSQVAPTPPLSPIAQPPLPPPQQETLQPSHDATISMNLLNTLLETCTTLTRKVKVLEQDKIAQDLEITKLRQRILLWMIRRMHLNGGGVIAEIDVDKDVTLEEVDIEKDAEVAADLAKDGAYQGRQKESQAHVYHIDLGHADKVLSMQDDEPEPAELKEKKGVVIRDHEETATPSTIVHSEPKSKDKGKGILFEEPKPLKKQAQIEQDEAYARELEAKLNKNINWDDVIEQVKMKEKEDNAVLRYQALKRKPKTKSQARKNMMVYLKIMAGFKMDFFKGMSYDDIRPILRSNSTLLFASSKPKNLSDDFLLTTLKAMFEKPDVEAHIWKNQKGSYGLAKVKSWKLLESCGVHITTFTTTQMILLVERIYPLARFTLDQMLNNVRIEVEEESKVSLKLLRFVRRQQQEGYRPDFGVDVVEDFQEYTLRDYYCWLKTYCSWYKLKLLDYATDSRLRLLEQSVAADDKMKK